MLAAAPGRAAALRDGSGTEIAAALLSEQLLARPGVVDAYVGALVAVLEAKVKAGTRVERST